MNRIDVPALLSALSLPRRGRVYDLGLELNASIPHNESFTRFAHLFTQTPEGTGAVSRFQYSADTIVGALHVGTHMDAFIHVQADNRIYGGEAVRDALSDSGWSRFGMETVPPIIGRGLLIDIAALKGLGRLADQYEITVDDIREALAKTRQSVRRGDFVLVRTGKIQDWRTRRLSGGGARVGREAAIWLYEAGMAVLATDTTGTEPLPFTDPAATTHRAMLVDRASTFSRTSTSRTSPPTASAKACSSACR